MSDSFQRDKKKSDKVKTKTVEKKPLLGSKTKSGGDKNNQWLETLKKVNDDEIPKFLKDQSEKYDTMKKHDN
jgi:hypothetical protein